MISSARDQLYLFDADDYFVERPIRNSSLGSSGRALRSHWDSVETGASGRTGFWFERTPAVFGCRHGVGPLIVGVDTSLLIALREGLEKEDGDLGFYVVHVWSNLESLEDALRDFIQLWWWRDVRLWASDLHLSDARSGPLSDTRRIARESAIQEVERDLFERGGIPDPSDIAFDLPSNPGRHLPDIELAAAAGNAGCHVFLTGDKGMRRWHRFFFKQGLAVLTTGDLLAALDASGELEDTPDMTSAPAPDLAAMSRLYGGFG